MKDQCVSAPTELEFETFKSTQISLMTNRLVLNSALRREVKVGDKKVVIVRLPIFENKNDPVNWLIKNISITFLRKNEIIKVSVTTSDPVQSAVASRESHGGKRRSEMTT